jgi:hypothetical protein
MFQSSIYRRALRRNFLSRRRFLGFASVDRIIDAKRGRRLVVESLEDRKMLSISTLPDDFQALSTELQPLAAAVMDVSTFETFELRFKQRFTEIVLEETIDFLNTFNPIPAPIGEFLTSERLNVPGLNQLLDQAGLELTPQSLMRETAIATGHPELAAALDGLKFFFELSALADDPLLESVSTDISVYDNFFSKLQDTFDVENFARIDLPIVNEFRAAKINAGSSEAQLEALAQNLTITLDTLTGAGPFGGTILEFNFSGDESAPIFTIDPRIPIIGGSLPSFAAGLSLGGSLNGIVRYTVGGGINLKEGLTIDAAEVAVGIGLSGDALLGIKVGALPPAGLSVEAGVDGLVGARLSPELDMNGKPGFQPEELIDQPCYFETFGGLRFVVRGSYPDPNPFAQAISVVRDRKTKQIDFKVFDELIWSASQESCHPSGTGAATLMDGMLAIEGTSGNDTITVTLDDSVPTNPSIVVTQNSSVSTFPLSTVSKVTIDTLMGNDTVTVDNRLTVPAIIQGSDGRKVFTGGGGNDELYGDDENDLLDGGFGDDYVHGGNGMNEIISAAGFDTLIGGADEDIFTVMGAALGATISGNEGVDELHAAWIGGLDRSISFDGGPGIDLIRLTGGGPAFRGEYWVGPASDQGVITYEDPLRRRQSIQFVGLEPIDDLMLASELTINGSGGDDVVRVVNGPEVLGSATTLVNFNDAFEEIRVANKPEFNIHGLGRNDRYLVNLTTPSAGLLTINLNGGSGSDSFEIQAHDASGPLPPNVQVNLNGGSVGGTDTLNVHDASPAPSQRIVLRQSLDPNAGSLIVGDGLPIVFDDIEQLHPNLTTNPNLVFLKGDPFEPNDTLATAWFLGSGAAINVDPRIDPGGDLDFYRFVADNAGSLDFQVFFTHADGDIDIDVRDAAGNVIASSLSADDDERITIPVVADRTYFLRIFGANDIVENVYNFTVLNDPAPVPELVDLTAATDSGRNDTDNVTFFDGVTKGPASFDIVLDDARIDEFVLLDFVPDTTDDDAPTAGADYGVEVFNNGVSIGFAFFTTDRLWRFTATAGDLGQGDNNYISAAVWIRDRSNPTNLGRGMLSSPLQVTVDNITPPVWFGLPDVASIFDGLTAASDTGVVTMPMTFADRNTSDTTPTFWGRAEANSVVRLWLDHNNNGIIDPAADIPDVFLGQAVAVPFDGNDAYPDGYWELTTVLDLNEIDSIPKDRLRRLLVTAEDVAGNPMPVDDEISAGIDELQIFIDTFGPQITNVQVADNLDFDLFDPKPSTNGYTPPVRSLKISLRDLPLRLDQPGGNNDFIDVAIKQDIAANPGNYLLVGDRVGTIAIQSIAVMADPANTDEPAFAMVTLNFAAPLPDDRYTLTVRDNLVDPVGNRLDGESNAAQPQASPSFASGDGVPGGNFVARFTIDSRPEIGSYVSQAINLDINGNFVWDPAGAQIGSDTTNVDLSFTLPAFENGLAIAGNLSPHELLVAGKFRSPSGQNGNGENSDIQGNGNNGGNGANGRRYFDQLATYGNYDGVFRWLIDLDSDGVVYGNGDPDGTNDLIVNQGAINGFNIAGAIPIAGNFDGAANNGDEIGLYYAGQWAIDTNHDYFIDSVRSGNLFGHPIVGDFDGNGIDDFAVFNSNRFSFGFNLSPNASAEMIWGFPGVLDRPVTADMDQDGIDDIGLWVPRTSANPPRVVAEWYFRVSNTFNTATRSANFNTVNLLNHGFSPVPFGADLYAEFGDERSLPIVGNFDPPVTTVAPGGSADLPGDYNRNGTVDIADRQVWRAGFGSTSNLAADGNHDGRVDSVDYVIWRNNLGKTAATAAAMLSPNGGDANPATATLTIDPVASIGVVDQRHSAGRSAPDRISQQQDFVAAVDRLFAELGSRRPAARPAFPPTSGATHVAGSDELLFVSLPSIGSHTEAEHPASFTVDGRDSDEAIDDLLANVTVRSDLFGSL